MTKMRVHELAKELGMDNKELVDILQKKNVEIKNHMSTIEDNVGRRDPPVKSLRREEKKAPVTENKGEDHAAGQAEAKEAAAPKKKNLAFVIRPQNPETAAGSRAIVPAQRQARPGQQGRPPGTGRSRRTSGTWCTSGRERDRYALNARRHGARPAAEGRPAPETRPSAERPGPGKNVRHRTHVLAADSTPGIRGDRHRLHARARAERPGQQGRPAAEGKPSTERAAQGGPPGAGVHMETVRETEEITEICPTVR